MFFGAALDVPEAALDVPEAARDVPEAARDVPDATRDVPETTQDVPNATQDVPETTQDVPETTDRASRAVLRTPRIHRTCHADRTSGRPSCPPDPSNPSHLPRRSHFGPPVLSSGPLEPIASATQIALRAARSVLRILRIPRACHADRTSGLPSCPSDPSNSSHLPRRSHFGPLESSFGHLESCVISPCGVPLASGRRRPRRDARSENNSLVGSFTIRRNLRAAIPGRAGQQGHQRPLATTNAQAVGEASSNYS